MKLRQILPLLAVSCLVFLSTPQGPIGEEKDSSATTSSMAGTEIEALTLEIIPRVEKIRGLAFKAPVPVEMVDDARAMTHFKKRLDKFYPKEQMEAEQTAYEQLGLLPEGSDMVGELFEVLEEQAGGYYDPETDTFYVLDDMPRAIAPTLIAHELTHALDDQHFSIDDYYELAKVDNDRAAVAGAVVEGSGVMVMSLFLMEEMAGGRMTPDDLEAIQESEAVQGERLRQAAPFLQRSLLAPYLIGQTFLLRGNLFNLMAGVKSDDIALAFREPPTSTEQLLHPEKYWDESSLDLPMDLTLPDLSGSLGKGWKKVGDGRLGELIIAILTGAGGIDAENLAAVEPSSWTNEAASGWGADQWHIYRKGKQTVTLLVTRWDSDQDAGEFRDGLKPLPGASEIVLQKDTVVVVAGLSGDEAGTLARAVLAGL